VSKRVKRLLATQKQYMRFCGREEIQGIPASVMSVSAFLVWFVEKQKGKTASVRGKLSQLRCASREFLKRQLLTKIEEAEVAKTVKVLKYHDWSEVVRMEPVTQEVLHELAGVRASGSKLDLLINLSRATPQNALLRCGELTAGHKGKAVEHRADKSGFGLRLGRTKTSRTGPGPKVELYSHGSGLSAVELEREWSRRTGRGAGMPEEYWLPELIMRKGRPVGIDWTRSMSRRTFVAALRLDIARIGRNPQRYCGHSFRAGGATDLFASGSMSHAEIMIVGRWKSLAAALIYFRADLEAARKSARVFGQIAGRIFRRERKG
jgi:hypothetical protein